MASTKSTPTILDNNVTLVAGAGIDGNVSEIWNLSTGYGGILYLKNTNGAIGPTIAAQSAVWCSPDNSNWYILPDSSGSWSLGNSVVSSITIPIPIEYKYIKVVSGGNTDQDTTFRAEGTEITSLTATAPGAITWSYTVIDVVTELPIADVDIWITTDIAGTNVIASGRSNQSGVAIFYLDAGVVYVWLQKSGYNFTNPDMEVVS